MTSLNDSDTDLTTPPTTPPTDTTTFTTTPIETINTSTTPPTDTTTFTTTPIETVNTSTTESDKATPADTESATITDTDTKSTDSSTASSSTTSATTIATLTTTTTSTLTSRASKDSNNKASKNNIQTKDSTKIRLLVSNIPYDLKWQDLKDLFKEKVGSEVCFVEIYEGPDGKSVGTGVIEVKGRELADRAAEVLHKVALKNRHLVVREEKEKDRQAYQRYGPYGDQQQHNSIPDNIHNNNNFFSSLSIDLDCLSNQIFVANLDYSVTVKKLKEVFLMAGTIIQVDLKMDKTGSSRGLATVCYENVVEAIQAIAMFNGHYLFERPMNVRMDRLGEVLHQHVPPILPAGLKGVGAGLGPTGQPLLNIGHAANILILNNIMSVTSAGKLMNVFLNPSLNKSGSYNNNSNKPRCTSTSALPQQPCNYNNTAYNQMYNTNDNNNPYNTFTNYNLAQLNGFRFPISNNSNYSTYNNNYSAYNYNNNYLPSLMRSPQQQQHTSPPKHDNTTVVVKNLPYSVTWQVLKDKFKEAGEVQFAEVRTEGGRSKGVGSVRYQSHEAAKKAAALFHGTRMEGRSIEVKTHF